MSSTTVRSPRTADPYADSDVVDARAPRFLQATVGVGAVTALVTGWWWLYGLLALQLVVGLVMGYALSWILIYVINKQSFGWTIACLLYTSDAADE